MTRKEQYKEVLRRLRRHYTKSPDAFVRWSTPLELLVATVLSAQCTDRRVNEVTATLFATYHTAEDYASANLATLKRQIRTTGFFNTKARYLKGIGQMLVRNFGGRVPQDHAALMTLPGVSNKTANLVMSKAFDVPVGVAVDTHVRRVAPRLGWTREHTNVKKIERDLNALIEPRDYLDTNEYLILLGRDLCRARPNCIECPLRDICPTGRRNLRI